MDVSEWLDKETVWYCAVCTHHQTDRTVLAEHDCEYSEPSGSNHVAAVATQSMPDRPAHPDHPTDYVAHTLTTREEQPVRVHLKDEEITIPTAPAPNRGSPPTDTVPCSSFDAVVEFAYIEDGGETLWARFHLPEGEWRRVGLQRHWDHEDADVHGDQRGLELWGSRFDMYDRFDESAYVPPVPDGSPVLTEHDAPGDWPDTPTAPFGSLDLSFYAAYAEDVVDFHNTWEEVKVGEVAAVEPLETLAEWPEEIEYESRVSDWSPPSRHPDIDYDELDPLDQTTDLLDAVFVINRHAKRLSEEGDAAYAQGLGADARAASLRKKALYKTKTVAIHRLVKAAPETVAVRKHTLGGPGVFWLVEFDAGYSFHQPVAAVEDELLNAVCDQSPEEYETTAIDFDASSKTDDLPCSLSTAVARLREDGIEPNDHLDATRVEDYDWGHVLSTEF
jgi:hypothetical protein